MSVDVMELGGVEELPDEAYPAPAAGGEPDEGAPYGYLKDGKTPKRKPGPAPGAGKTMPPPRGRRRTTSRRGGSSSTSTPPRASSSAAATDPTLVAGAEALLSLPAQLAGLAGLGLRLAAAKLPPDPQTGAPTRRARDLHRHSIGFSADAAALVVHGPALAEGLADLSEDLPWMAGVLTKAASFGSKSKLVTAVAGLVLQGLVNHGYMPAHPMLGTIEPAELVKQVMGEEPAG